MSDDLIKALQKEQREDQAEIERLREEVARLRDANREAILQEYLTAATLASLHERTLPRVKWRHVKTGGVYEIVWECIIEATNKPAVLYRSIIPELARSVWARPSARLWTTFRKLSGLKLKSSNARKRAEKKMLTDPEFWLLVAPCWALGGWVGWKLAEWEEEGFDEIFRIDVRYRFVSLFRSIARF